MRVVFSPRAVQRLREIQSFIAYDNVAAANRVVNRIRQSAEILGDHPYIGRNWDGRSRALAVSGLPYRLHYRVDEASATVEVITLVHTSQKPKEIR